MSIISEVKCARCDRKYSGVRSRCPYCGARRIGRGKYSEESDNSKGKMLIGILIMGVLVIAATFLLLANRSPDVPEDKVVMDTPPSIGKISTEDDTITVTGNNPAAPSSTPTPTPEELQETPAPSVRSVMITYSNKKKEDFTAKVAEQVVLGVKIDPIDFKGDIVWSSSDESVFQVVANNVDGTQAKVTGIGKGNAKVTVTVGGVQAECIVRVIKK